MSRRRKHRSTPSAPTATEAGFAPATSAPPVGSALVSIGPSVRAHRLTLTLLAATWLYVWLWVEPPLRYHRSAPAFFLRSDFLAEHLSRPGGLLDYASAWLAQLDCRAVLGASVSTALIGLVAGGLVTLLRSRGGWSSIARFLTVLLLLTLSGQYDFPWWTTSLGLLLAAWGAVAWQAWRPANVALRWAALSAATALWFYLAGLVPGVLFALLASMGEAAAVLGTSGTAGGPGTAARPPSVTPLISAVVPGAAILIPIAGALILAETSWREFLPPWGRNLPLVTGGVLHLFFPAILWLSWSVTGVRRVSPSGPATGQARRGRERRLAASPRTFQWSGRVAGLALAVGMLVFTFDRNQKAALGVEWEAQEGRWERALDAARGLRVRLRPATRLALTQALFHTGQLNENLFAFPQRKGADLLPSMREGMAVCAPLSDTLLELGQVGLAEHFAHEALENAGERPHLLWQLSRINVLQERPHAARVFLNRLRQVPFHRKEADRRLRALEADPTLSGEADIARVRPLLVTSDYAESGMATEFLLRQLLQSNRRNRMAFEYLTAHYLLTDQVDALVQNLGGWNELGLWETPRHVEEALLAHLAAKGEERTEVAGRRVSAETGRRHREFQAQLSRNGGRMAGLEPRFARKFGDTFWFYQLLGVTFGATPLTFTASRE